MERKNKILVAVEGNIGCGKSTCLEILKTCHGVEIYKEPVESWQNIGGENLLALMYENPDRWSLAFQTYVQLTMLKVHTAKQTKPCKVIERSLFSARYCFIENLYQSGKMSEVEFKIITEYFDWLIQNVSLKPDVIIYLQTDPSILHKRIARRFREEEMHISLEYLKKLHNLHDDWLIFKKRHVPCEVKVINANKSQDEVVNKFMSIINEIRPSVSKPLAEIQLGVQLSRKTIANA